MLHPVTNLHPRHLGSGSRENRPIAGYGHDLLGVRALTGSPRAIPDPPVTRTSSWVARAMICRSSLLTASTTM